MTPPELTSELTNLGPMRTLVATVIVGSLTRGAIELGLAQSVASRHIREMERLFCGPLFHRTGRGMEPTDLLRDILPRVKALLAMADELAAAGRDLAGVPSGPVTLGLVGGVSRLIAPAIFSAVSMHYPNVRLRFREGYSGDMEEALAQGRIDIAVLNRYQKKGASGYRKLFETQLCAVGRPSVLEALIEPMMVKTGRSSRKFPDTLSVHTLIKLPLVLPFAPNAMRNILDEYAHRQGLTVRVAVECDSLAVMRSMLLEQECIGVLPTHGVIVELASGTLSAIPLTESAFRQSVVLATSSEHPFTLPTKSVASLIPGVVSSLLKDL
jgi:LysR family nitrogen assimilation transcriptional regulator